LAPPLVLMIIFIADDRAYLYWVMHHRQGFVLDGRRKPKLSHLVLHRATCNEIKSGGAKRSHWTTGGKLKVCSASCDELQAWVVEESGVRARGCEICQPEQELPIEPTAEIHLTKLDAEILDYILDAAVIHLEHEHPPYQLTVSDIAACFGKTPAQVSPALHRLIQDGLVTLDGKLICDSPIPARRIVWPTIRGLRSIEAFQAENDEALASELTKLHMD
jgi:hypothetical protein